MNTETSHLLVRLRIEEQIRQAAAERLAQRAKLSAPRRRRTLPRLGPILVRLPWRTGHV